MNTTLTSESIPCAFARAAANFGSKIALRAPAGQWTYAELDRSSDFFAAGILQRLGEKSEPVALLLEHDAPLIAAILGALKANKIYVALDPSHPPEQLTAMLASSCTRLMVADQANVPLANSLAAGRMEVFVLPDSIPHESPRVHFQEISNDAGAWLMFTSGSTSTPKGVWQNHIGLVHEAEIYTELAHLVPEDRVSLLTACGLSASGATLFGALLHGATLCMFHLRSQGVQRLADWLRREQITVFHSVPTVFRHLAQVADGNNSFATVRLVRLGGEPALTGDVEIYRRLCSDECRLVQSFSSTETGMVSTFTMDKKSVLTSRRVPAGCAVRGVEIFLVDGKNLPLTNGGEGKIAVRSPRLRQGYWRQPELTAGMFLSDERNPNSRIFISNDVGRFLPDGTLEHLGRADQLVKIRGQRVDLGEVEAALLATRLAQEAVVTAHEDANGQKRLAAYFVPRAGADISPQHFLRQLRGQLPEYMIPSDLVPLEKLPLTAAGKIDRGALPSPATRVGKKISLSHAQRPRDVIEARLKRIWEATLNISPIARTDDFFELGGTSLQSVEVLLDIEELFDVSLPPSTLVEHSTIAELSASLADQVVLPSPSLLVPLRNGTGRRPLFLIHNGQGDVASFGLLARRLPDRPIYALQSVGLQGECWPLMSVRAMARRYLREIIAKDPTGPYLLAGACMGGLIAFELAQMLIQQKRQVGLLALLDTSHPVQRWRQPGWKEKLYCPARDALRDALRIARWSVLRTSGLGRGARWLPGYRRFVANMNFLASRFYKLKFYHGTITIFVSADDQFSGEDRRLLLRCCAKDAVVVTIPGRHIGLFARPAVDELARQLKMCLDLAERKNAS